MKTTNKSTNNITEKYARETEQYDMPNLEQVEEGIRAGNTSMEKNWMAKESVQLAILNERDVGGKIQMDLYQQETHK